MRTFLFIIQLAFLTVSCSGSNNDSGKIKWEEMTPSVFEQAKSENKIILLNLEANWCHWCHVMEDSTYSNPEIIAYINEHFIPVKADQDANPELSIRYKDYGWPATIFINGKGEDVVKRAGYIAPEYFLKLLKAIVADPSLEEAIPDIRMKEVNSSEVQMQIERLTKNARNSVDYKKGGFDQSQKYVEYATFEYALFKSNDEDLRAWVKTSMNGAKNLSDPVWGGIYQYSTHNDWNHLHFEKLLSIQARYLKLFSYNYLYNQDNESLDKAKDILKYLERFLAHGNGLYSNAQDADLIQGEHSESYFKLNNTERLKLGVPKVDTNSFTNNNAEIASSLLLISDVLEDKILQQKAVRIEMILNRRKGKNGLFFHDFGKREVYSLKDQIAMAFLYIDLIKTGLNNDYYTKELTDLLKAVNSQFSLENGSVKSFVGSNGLQPAPIIIENINLGRINNWAYNQTKDKQYQVAARELFNFILNPQVIKEYYSLPELLMFESEINAEANQYVFVDNKTSSDFLQIARAMAPFNSVIGVYSTSTLPADKKELFGEFKQDVLFVCTSSYCSSPIRSKEDVFRNFK